MHASRLRQKLEIKWTCIRLQYSTASVIKLWKAEQSVPCLRTVAQECGSTLPALETVRKGKLQGVRTFSGLSHESHAARTIPSAVFHPALRISKENNDDEIYYFNQASTFRSRLSSLWPNVTAGVILILCHRACWKSLLQNLALANKALYIWKQSTGERADSLASTGLSSADLSVWLAYPAPLLALQGVCPAKARC